MFENELQLRERVLSLNLMFSMCCSSFEFRQIEVTAALDVTPWVELERGFPFFHDFSK